jgi:hypothetical protein
VASSMMFAVDVFRCVCERLSAKAAELQAMAETAAPFDEWLTWEAFLACQGRATDAPFCEVTARPTYASEGVADEADPARNVGDLRVGGPNDGADHCWLFAEFALLHDGNRTGDGRRQVEAAADKLLRLGWKESAALLIAVVVNPGEGRTDLAEELAGCAVANRPALTAPFVISLPGGGKVVLSAFDIKRDPADTLTTTGR